MSLRDEIAAAAGTMLAITRPTEPLRTESPVNDAMVTLERMKSALMTTSVTMTERLILLYGMAAWIDAVHAGVVESPVALDADSLLYFGGHEPLALTLGKPPGSREAQRAVDRVLASLVAKGLLRARGTAYELLVLRDALTAEGALA